MSNTYVHVSTRLRQKNKANVTEPYVIKYTLQVLDIWNTKKILFEINKKTDNTMKHKLLGAKCFCMRCINKHSDRNKTINAAIESVWSNSEHIS